MVDAQLVLAYSTLAQDRFVWVSIFASLPLCFKPYLMTCYLKVCDEDSVAPLWPLYKGLVVVRAVAWHGGIHMYECMAGYRKLSLLRYITCIHYVVTYETKMYNGASTMQSHAERQHRWDNATDLFWYSNNLLDYKLKPELPTSVMSNSACLQSDENRNFQWFPSWRNKAIDVGSPDFNLKAEVAARNSCLPVPKNSQAAGLCAQQKHWFATTSKTA